eukprot:TRINITY_DN3112_c0_g1_i1.p1 TRINITY_DN3112_c0_g1~~TRINITY_DN3112_c0_g1_i1.p1  ORF type:complete len:320 (+),score=55.61 TRINITY_DN3112_c0_g1_i1:72-962(+)
MEQPDLASCPICGRNVRLSAIEAHVNSCLDSGDFGNRVSDADSELEALNIRPLYESRCCNLQYFSWQPCVCATCQQPIEATVHLVPFQVAQPRCLVIRATVGFSSWRYRDAVLLHVGISDSRARVYNFDQKGQRAEEAEPVWNLSLSVPLECPQMSDQAWDEALHQHLLKDRRQHGRYDEFDNNCFGFAVRFLNDIQFEGHTNHTKLSFAKRLETPVASAEQFVALCQEISRARNHIFSRPLVIHVCDGCGIQIPLGQRFRCDECQDVDLCTPCYENSVTCGAHLPSHEISKAADF